MYRLHDERYLIVSNNAFEGPVGLFNRWRLVVGYTAGIPMVLMDGWVEDHPLALPSVLGMDSPSPFTLASWCSVPWDCLRRQPVNLLLRHPDDRGTLKLRSLRALSRQLRALSYQMQDTENGSWKTLTRVFADGCDDAWNEGRGLLFSVVTGRRRGKLPA